MKDIIMSKKQAELYDLFLETLCGSPHSIEEMNDPRLSYHKDIIALLEKEGFVQTDNGCIEISFKGRVFYDDGGFVRQFRRTRRVNISTIIAAIASVVAAIGTIISILL